MFFFSFENHKGGTFITYFFSKSKVGQHFGWDCTRVLIVRELHYVIDQDDVISTTRVSLQETASSRVIMLLTTICPKDVKAQLNT